MCQETEGQKIPNWVIDQKQFTLEVCVQKASIYVSFFYLKFLNFKKKNSKARHTTWVLTLQYKYYILFIIRSQYNSNTGRCHGIFIYEEYK